MFCIHCGTELPQDAQFCAACGRNVSQTTRLSGEQPSFVTLTPKKKSKAKPVIIAASAFAAVGVVGAVAGMGFQSGIKQTLMGEEKYARSVFDNTVDSFVGEDSLQTAGSLGVAALRSAAAADECSTEEEMLAYSVCTLMGELSDGGVSTTLGLDIQPSDSLCELIYDELEYQLDMGRADCEALLRYLCSSYISVDQKSAEDTYACAVRFGSGDDELVSAAFSYNKNGDAYLAFPEASENAVFMQLAAIPDAEAAPEIDDDELDQLADALSEAIDKYYEQAEIEIRDDTLCVGRAEYDGKCVEAVFKDDLLAQMVYEIAELAVDNEFFEELMYEFSDGYYEKAAFLDEAEYIADFIRDDGTFALSVRSYVTNSDKVVGAEIGFGNYEAVFTLSALETDEYFAVAFGLDTEYDSDNFEISVLGEKETADSGVMTIEYVMPYYGVSIDFDITYRELAVVDGCVTGTFELEMNAALTELLDLEGEYFYIGDEEINAEKLVRDSVLIFSSAKEGGGVRLSIGAENKDYGYFGFYIAVSDEAADIPITFSSTVDAENIYAADGADFIEEVGNYYCDKVLDTAAFDGLLKYSQIESRADLLQAVIGSDDISDYIQEYYDRSEYAAHTIMTHPVI